MSLKLNKKQKEHREKVMSKQQKEIDNDNNWNITIKRLGELGILDALKFDSKCSNHKNNCDITDLIIEVNELIDRNEAVPYDLKLKLLRKTRPELFNSDGTPKVDISKLGNIE